MGDLLDDLNKINNIKVLDVEKEFGKLKNVQIVKFPVFLINKITKRTGNGWFISIIDYIVRMISNKTVYSAGTVNSKKFKDYNEMVCYVKSVKRIIIHEIRKNAKDEYLLRCLPL